MVVTPRSGRILGVGLQVKPENNEVKVTILSKILHHHQKWYSVIHDRNRLSELGARRIGALANLKHFTIDVPWLQAQHQSATTLRNITSVCRGD